MVKQIDIFGNEVDILVATYVPEVVNVGNRYPRMTEKWGITADCKCGDCEYFLRLEYHDKIYKKCDKWIVSHSTATDIRVKDQACGLFEPKGE